MKVFFVAEGVLGEKRVIVRSKSYEIPTPIFFPGMEVVFEDGSWGKVQTRGSRFNSNTSDLTIGLEAHGENLQGLLALGWRFVSLQE